MKRIVLAWALLGAMTAAAMSDTPAETTANLKLRKSPSPQGVVLATIPAGAALVMGGCADGWCEVTFDGIPGFASQQYLAVSASKWTNEEAAWVADKAEACDRNGLDFLAEDVLEEAANAVDEIGAPDEDAHFGIVGSDRASALDDLVDTDFVLGQLTDESCRYWIVAALRELTGNVRAGAGTLSDDVTVARLEAVLARLLTGLGAFDLAAKQGQIGIAALDKAIARVEDGLASGDISSSKRDDAVERAGALYGDRARIRLDQGDRDAAVADFEASLTRDPDNADLRLIYYAVVRPAPVPKFPAVALNGDGTDRRFEKASSPSAVAASPDGTKILVGYGGEVGRVWDWRRGAVFATIDLHEFGPGQPGSPRQIEFTGDGNSVLSKAGVGLFEGRLDAVSLDGTRRWSITTPTTGDFALSETAGKAFVPNEDFITVVDIETGKALHQFGPFAGDFDKLRVHEVFGSRDGSVLATVDTLGNVLIIIDGATGKQLNRNPTKFPATSISLSPAGDLLATYSEDRFLVDVRETRAARPLATLDGHSAAPWGVSFSSDGRLLASFGADGTTIVWDARTGEMKQRLVGHLGQVADGEFFADDRLFVTASLDGSVRIWSVADGRELVALYALADSPKGVDYLSVLPDGAFAGSDRAISAAISYDAAGEKQTLTEADRARLALGETLGNRLAGADR